MAYPEPGYGVRTLDDAGPTHDHADGEKDGEDKDDAAQALNEIRVANLDGAS